MGLLDAKFNIVNIIVTTFIFGLGVDYSIFITQGLTQKHKFNTDSLISYKKSIGLSAITTLVGIGVLIFAQHPALKSIALLAIVGIVSVIFLTFTLQPILYDFLIQKRKEKRAHSVHFSNAATNCFRLQLFSFWLPFIDGTQATIFTSLLPQ